jgi:hypothetical protein
MTGDKPKALIPLNSQLNLNRKLLPKRLIVKYGSNPQDLGLLIITPGSTVESLVETKTDCSAQELESAISQVLLNTVNLADNVKVSIDEERVLVDVTNPRLADNKMWIYGSIGTPIASLVASVVTQVLDKPVQIQRESFSKNKCLIELKKVSLNI